jgi:hypothetical protein
MVSALQPAPATLKGRCGMGQTCHNLALCAVKLEKPKEAHANFLRVMDAYAALGQKHAVARVAGGLGQLLSALGRFREARVFWRQAWRSSGGSEICEGNPSRAVPSPGRLSEAVTFPVRPGTPRKSWLSRKGPATGAGWPRASSSGGTRACGARRASWRRPACFRGPRAHRRR